MPPVAGDSVTLSSEQVPHSHRSSDGPLGRCVVVPLLRGATTYRRAAGFFSSTSLTVLRPGLEPLLRQEGVFELVCSPRLPARDVAALIRCVEEPASVLADTPNLDVAFSRESPAVLAYLVASRRLRMRIARPRVS